MTTQPKLPPEQELAEKFGVSKPTLRRALAELAVRGIIVKQNGIGSVVAGSSKVIAKELVFLCHDIVFFAESLKTFSLAASAANYLPSIIPLAGDAAGQERIIATAIARKPAGIVLYADPGIAYLNAYRQLEAGRGKWNFPAMAMRGISNFWKPEKKPWSAIMKFLDVFQSILEEIGRVVDNAKKRRG